METAEKVKQILVDQLCVKPSEVKPEARLIDDLGADSLDIIELTMSLEEDLQIEVPDEDAEKLLTVNDVILYCEAKTA